MHESREFYKLQPDEICKRISQSYQRSICLLKGVSFEIHEHVYPSQEFRSSRLILDCVQELAADKSVCDMGCGMGVIGIFALNSRAKLVVQADINPFAIENAKANKSLHGFPDQKLQIYESDCFDAIPPQKFDLIIFNTPFHSEEHEFHDPIERAFYDPNFQTLKKFLSQSISYMNEDSQVMIAFSNKGDVPELERLFSFYSYEWKLWRVANSDQQYDSRIYLLRKKGEDPLNGQYYKLSAQDIFEDVLHSEVESRIKVKNIDFILHEHVYPSNKFRTTEFVLNNIQPLLKGAKVCDMGCGLGVVGIFALYNGAVKAVQADINPFAIKNAIANKQLHKFSDEQLAIYESDCFDKIPKQVFDLIVFNMPYHSEPMAIKDPLEHAFHDPEFQSLHKFLSQAPDYSHSNTKISIAFSNKGDVKGLEQVFNAHNLNWQLWRITNTDQEFDNRIYLLSYN